MTGLPGFYCYDPTLDRYLNWNDYPPQPVHWDQARPILTVEECQRIKDMMPELEFYYVTLPMPEGVQRIPVPLFPSRGLPAATDP